jgi:hypothetical protein
MMLRRQVLRLAPGALFMTAVSAGKFHHEKTSILLLFCDPRRRLRDGERSDEPSHCSRGT